MKPIEADDQDGITLELETWVRSTATSPLFSGAMVLVMRDEGGAYFSCAAYTPEVRLQMGAMMMHLGKQMAEEAQKQGATIEGKRKPRRLVGIS